MDPCYKAYKDDDSQSEIFVALYLDQQLHKPAVSFAVYGWKEVQT